MTVSSAETPVVQPSTTQPSAAPVLSLGAVALSVADLGRSLEYYQHAIGLRALEQGTGWAMLGVRISGTESGSGALLELHEEPGAKPSLPGHTGLYHLAILLPSRADLGRFMAHLMADQIPVQGASDHLVSEAVYLQDPDGHGIEIYADRGRASWNWQSGQVRMGTLAADVGSIVASAGTATAWRGLPARTTVGHVHLKVSDLKSTRAFYEGLLDLDVVVDMARQGALFVSQGGYHHHFGLNVWQSRGGKTGQDGEARLLSVRVNLPSAELAGVRARLLEADYPVIAHPLPTDPVTAINKVSAEEHAFTVSDPSGNLLRFGSRTSHDSSSASSTFSGNR